ncbi:Xanthine/uracil permease [Pterulicium gracile]|uniref:Xanthine/uracil permease n=1 Tax=Pterulicium gracile TaxID=1884261 RepID=A0A5C3Q9Z3_9AGAR|nr:Xanthine/uracil permease [Pterula gracilis]
MTTSTQPQEISAINADGGPSRTTTPTPHAHHRPRLTGVSQYMRDLREKASTRDGWLGEYSIGWLCLPTLPFGKASRRRPPPFYSLDADLPLLVAIVCGFQHALAMLAGLITPPIIFASALSLPPELQAYMISASLIGCGILSMVQISRIPLFKGYYLGTGLLSVVGTSFSTLSTANSIFNAMYADGTCPSTTAEDGTVTRGSCPDAYGMVLGTSMICSFIEIFLAFVPSKKLRRVFPPLVTGLVVMLIGASLIGESGILNWGGGSNDCHSRPESGIFQLCPTIFAPKPLLWGSPEFIGLGFLSFSTIVLTELFGSPFLKNASIIVGLLVGCIVAGAAGYMDDSSIRSAPAITFLWVYTFKIRVYPPAILPMLAVYVTVATEAIGDITASCEVSRVAVEGPEFDSRIQGGILSDGIGGFVSALFTNTPLSVFAQNNGVIALTRCANRTAGRFCCLFLVLFGILGKLSGVFLAVPNSVLGGVTTFLFANVVTSGIRVLCSVRWTRRDRFILSAALLFGIGNLIVPEIFTHLFDGVGEVSGGLRGLLDSITIILTTPFLIAGVVAVVLNLIIPEEVEDAPVQEEDRSDLASEVESTSKGEKGNDVTP